MRMKIFGVLIIAHWLEHLFQAYQVYVLHMHRECALGLLGMKYPWLIRTESLHFAFAYLTWIGMWIAGAAYFERDKAATLWIIGWWVSAVHLFEHVLLFSQAMLNHNLFHSAVPTSLLQLFFPRIELHLAYNSVITFFIVAALIAEHWNRYEMYPGQQFYHEHNPAIKRAEMKWYRRHSE